LQIYICLKTFDLVLGHTLSLPTCPKYFNTSHITITLIQIYCSFIFPIKAISRDYIKMPFTDTIVVTNDKSFQTTNENKNTTPYFHTFIIHLLKTYFFTKLNTYQVWLAKGGILNFKFRIRWELTKNKKRYLIRI